MAYLTILDEGGPGRRYEIEQNEVAIGRAAQNTLTIEDPSVSGRHCILFRAGRKYTLRDLGSTNGTTVNGIAVRESRLKPGDEIRIGNVPVQFDGTDVEVDQAGEAAVDGTSQRPPTVRMTVPAVTTGFGTRKESKRLWPIIVVALVLLAVAAAVYFVLKLSGTN